MGTKTALFAQKQSGGVFTIEDQSLSTGDRWFVCSTTGTDSAGAGRNPDAPFATIDYAIGNCTASKGDIIFVMPGHAENVADATDLLADVAGITIKGLGFGSLTPTISLITDAAATISITAANVTVENLRIYSNFTNGVTAGVTLGANADGCVLRGLYFTEAANTKEFLIGISIAAACNDVIIENCRYMGIAGGTTSSAIAAAGATNNTIIRNNYIQVDASAAAVKLDGAASTDLWIEGNRVINIDTGAGLGIACHATSNGFMSNNHVMNLKNDVVGVSGAAMAFCENYCTNAVTASGIIKPTVDS